MVPATSAVGALTGITFNGDPVAYTTQTIKGVQYAFFRPSGAYRKRTAVDKYAAYDRKRGFACRRFYNVDTATNVTAAFSEAMDAGTVSTATVELRDALERTYPERRHLR